MLHRVQQIIDASVALGRKVSFVGRSMVRNMGIAKDLGFLTVDDDDVVDIAAAEMLPAERVTLVTTGTQGERWPRCRGCRAESIAASL